MNILFWKKKQKNRRLGREYVLDVKLRSSQIRATRTRLTLIGLSALFAAVFCFYMVWRSGEYALNRLIYQNPTFALQQIEVQTDGVIAPDQLRRWAGVKVGDNLLSLDLARIKRDLEMVPMVQFVSIERILPHTLRIGVQEREPIAQVNVPRPRPGGGLEVAVFLLDAAGWVMMPLEPLQRSVPAPEGSSYPLIVGLTANQLQAGRRIESPQVLAALELLNEFEHSPMVGLTDIRQVDVSAQDVLVAKTIHNSEVTFSLKEPSQQLSRWRQIFDVGQRQAKAIASVDLAVNNNIPVRWIEPEAAAAAPIQKTVKPLKPRKKNV